MGMKGIQAWEGNARAREIQAKGFNHFPSMPCGATPSGVDAREICF